MDLRVLVLCDLVITVLFGIAYLVYLLQQKTYPGFTAWTIGTFVMAAGYLAAVLRPVTPLGLSIVLTNLLVVLASVIRLDAIRRFVLARRLPKVVYGLPLVVAAGCAVFFYAVDRIAIRGAIASVGLVMTMAPFAWTLLRNQPPQGRLLYRFAAGFVALDTAALLIRAVMWLIHPEQQLLTAGWSHALMLFVALASEAGLGVIILLLTSQRSEARLAAANSELEAVNVELRAALAEVKTLQGILPICLHCKRIRDDDGCWQRVETYVRDRSDADFSHGICPECAKEHYPEYNLVSKDGE